MSTRISPAALAAVALGGALGALARWLLGEWFPDGDLIPTTTLAINVGGSCALGLLPAWPLVRESAHGTAFVGTGILGGFTTMSTYAVQVHDLLAGDRFAWAGLYLGGTLGAAVLGAALAELLVVRRLASAQGEQQVADRGGDR